jgi:hypothetical protein
MCKRRAHEHAEAFVGQECRGQASPYVFMVSSFIEDPIPLLARATVAACIDPTSTHWHIFSIVLRTVEMSLLL